MAVRKKNREVKEKRKTLENEFVEKKEKEVNENDKEKGIQEVEYNNEDWKWLRLVLSLAFGTYSFFIY